MSNEIRINLQLGACQDVLKQYPDNHFDCVITDPPYGLGVEPDPVTIMRAWIQEETLKGSGGFMGVSWDSTVPSPTIFREILRVVKPGGVSCFFAGTRTLHLMMASLRIAGWEIEGVNAYIYGSGFPKSMNIYKAITKRVNKRYGEARCSCEGCEGYSEELFIETNVLDQERKGPRKIVLDDYEGNALTTRVCSWCAKPCQAYLDSTEGLGTSLKPAWEPCIIVKRPLQEIKIDFEELLPKYGFSLEQIRYILTP